MLTSMISNYISSNSLNGSQATVTDLQPRNITTGTTSARIGEYFGDGSNLNGTISEILIFNRALQNDERQQVEGYLAWKWGLVQNLPVTHPYYYAKAPQSAFQPTSFPSCALWLDAADGNTVSSNVTQWTDKSGQDNHLISNASYLSPTYNPSVRGIRFTTSATTPTASILERS